MPFVLPFLFPILQETLPIVGRPELVGSGSEVAATIFTFTDVTLGPRLIRSPGRFGAHENVIGDIPLVPSTTGRGIFAFVHGLDAATVFNVSSVTIGGVAGTELVDRAGATNAVNSAIYGWSDSSLADITTFDVVVTWSEQISACTCVVIEVANIRSFGAIATGTATGTGTLLIDVTGVADAERVAGGGVILVASCVNAGDPIGTPDATFNGAGTGPMDAMFPQLIHKFNGATVLTSADVYYIIPSINGHGAASIQNISLDWPGTAISDAVAIYVA